MSDKTFINGKTGTKNKILRSKDNETETVAIDRLKKLGWDVTDYKFDRSRKIFFKK